MKHLDPRFHLVAVLIDDPDETPEMRATARRHAESIAQQCGLSFDEAMKRLVRPIAANAADECPEAEELPTDEPEPDVDPTIEVDQESATPVEAAPDAANGQIADALKADPARSDRDLARTFGASPTTVGKLRGALGLDKAVRTVTRRGKAYDMQVGDRS